MRVGEGIGHGLVQAAGAHGVVHHVQSALSLGANAEAATATGQRGGDLVHAVQAKHLFVQVDLAREVGAEGGAYHVQGVGIGAVGYLAAQAAKDVHHELARNLSAHHVVEAADTELQVGLLGLQRPLVDDAIVVRFSPAYRAAGNLGDKGSGCRRAHIDAMIVHAALVAHGALGDKPQVAAGAAGAARFERRGFQQNVHRFLGYLGIKAAHHAGQRNGAQLGSGDNGHVGSERALLAIERGELLALFSGADNDVRLAVCVLQLGQVEGVKRLAEQEQDVVGNVDDVVDGALADGGKAFHHPVGAGAHLAAADDASGIARATGLVGDGDAHLGIERGRFLAKLQLAGHFRKRAGVGLLVHGAHFAREAHDGKAVGTVRGDLQVEHRVGELQVVGDGLAGGGIFGEHPNALVVVAHAQLALGAAHAAAGNAAQLRLLDLEVAGQHRADGGNGHLDAGGDVGRAAHDLHGLFSAHVHRGHMHMIGIGMVDAGKHMANHHAVEGIAQAVHAFNARAGKVQAVAELLGVFGHLRVLRKPFQGYFHVRLFLSNNQLAEKPWSEQGQQRFAHRRRAGATALELAQEAHIAFKQHAQVGHVVLQAGNALDAHAEGEAGVHLGVDARHAKDVRVHHAAAQDLDPTGALAHAALLAVVQMAGAAAHAAAHVGFSGRLGEREVMCAEAGFALGAEHLLAEVIQGALQVAEGDALVYHQALALVELGQVAGVGHIAAVHLAGGDHVDGKLAVFHGVHLNARGLRAQQHGRFAFDGGFGTGVVLHVERVGQAAAGMVFRGVERREVVPVGFHFRAGEHGVAQAQEDLGDLVGDGVDKVTRAHLLGAAGQRDVDGVGFHLGLELGVSQLLLLGLERSLDLVAGGVHRLAHLGAMLLGNLAHGAQVAGERARLAHNLYADLLQRIGRRRLADSLERIGMQGLDIVDN